MLDKMKQMQQAKKMQKVLGQEEVTGEAVGGRVKMTMDGNHKIKGIDISSEVLAPENKEQIENGLKEAHENAQKELQALMIKKVQSGEISF